MTLSPIEVPATAVLVTGANGFVGQAVVDLIKADPSIEVRAAYRSHAHFRTDVRSFSIGELDAKTDWSAALAGVSVVIHTAARVHVMNEVAGDPLEEFRRVNVSATLHLARQAVENGARRFIFISSIKVNGEQTDQGRPFTAQDSPRPLDAYGVSKMEAESSLLELGRETGLEVVIIRPTLVYGPGVKANFRNLMSWVNKSVPLPLGAINNKRSLVSVYNLADLIHVCVFHPNAVGKVFLVSDNSDVSTTELLQHVARALNKRALLMPVPMGLISGLAQIIGKGDFAQRLCGSLQVDISYTCKQLNWSPPVPLELGLMRTTRHFKETLN
jgi:nucleoside-diphosphate-sugar epimerase